MAEAANASDGGNRNPDNRHDKDALGIPYRDICGKCGARRIDAQLGLEPTPEEYVSHLVEVFREVRRVLRDDGTLWLNLGDSYASGKGTCFNPGGGPKSYIQEKQRYPLDRGNVTTLRESNLKPKDLVGIPWMVAFALRADGWWLRSEIIWQKPAPMPESVRDRPTKSHEQVFLLAKSAHYYYDADAIAEPSVTNDWNGSNFDDPRDLAIRPTTGRKPRESKKRGEFNGKTEAVEGRNAFRAITQTRNKRDVWTVATQPYSAAHFATFPPKLIEPMILAGCPAGGVVLDPFGGSGTTGAVAKEWGREFILIELNADYIELAHERIRAVQPRLVLA